jgi:hypothetical protein
MRKFPLFFAMTFLLTGALSSLSHASETRLNSLGGVSLVLDDETASFDPFNFGDPAGLALLPPLSRFDVSGVFSMDTPAFDPAGQTQTYGTLSKIGSNFPNSTLLSNTSSTFTYQGLILFPDKSWAFQASGDLLHATNQPDTLLPATSVDRTRGMARVAVDLDPLVLGTEIDATQTQKVFPNLFSGGPRGTGNGSALFSNSGLLLDLPLDHNKTPARMRIGGVFGTEIPAAQEKDGLTVNSGGTPVDLTVTFAVPTYMSFGPEVFLEVPGSLQASLLGRVGHSESHEQLDSSNSGLIPPIPDYLLETDDSLLVFGGMKTKLPLAGTLRQKLTVNTGTYFLIGNIQTKGTDPTGSPTQSTNASDLQIGMGVGLENAGDFTLGLQAAMDSRSGNWTPVSGTGYTLDYFGYSISMGGEKWLNENWALRGGLNFEDDMNDGGATVDKVHYQVQPGARIVATTLSAGLGFKVGSFRGDLDLWTGQPSLYNSPNPSDFITQGGIQGTLSFLFN